MSKRNLLLEKIEQENLWEKHIVLERNDFLKSGGNKDTNIYFVVEGSLRIFVLDEYEDHTIRFGYQNNFIVDLDSFIREKASDYYIQALKKTIVKCITKSKFKSLVQDVLPLQQEWNSTLEQIILQSLEREVDILTTSPLERYRRVLKRSPQLFQEIPNKYIASYLRMTPETLSRIKKS